MKKVASMTLLVLVVSMIFSGIPISAEAQDDSSFLLKIALNAQRHVQQLISSDSSEEVKRLYEEASNEVTLLEESLENGDVSSARQHFQSAMNIFKKITQMISSQEVTAEASSLSVSSSDLMSKLDRLEKYLISLKAIAERHDAGIDFTEIDELIETTKENIDDGNLAEAEDNIIQLRQMIFEIKNTLDEQTRQKKVDRVKLYVERYLVNLDRLIEHLETQEYSQTTIDEFEEAKTNLASASDIHEVIQQIKHINKLIRNLN